MTDTIGMETTEQPIENNENDENKIILKPKRKQTEKQREITSANLAKGRLVLAERKKKQKEEAMKTAEDLVVKKADKLVRQKANKEKQRKSSHWGR